MCSGFGIDKLTCDTHAISSLAHATFEYVADPKLAADLFHVDGPAFVGKTRIACDHKQPAKARQRHRDVFHDAIGEILLLRVGAEVLEGQHGNRGIVRER